MSKKHNNNSYDREDSLPRNHGRYRVNTERRQKSQGRTFYLKGLRDEDLSNSIDIPDTDASQNKRLK